MKKKKCFISFYIFNSLINVQYISVELNVEAKRKKKKKTRKFREKCILKHFLFNILWVYGVNFYFDVKQIIKRIFLLFCKISLHSTRSYT